MKADRRSLDESKFASFKPFDLGHFSCIRNYHIGMPLYFQGFPSEKTDVDYGLQRFSLHCASGNLEYLAAASAQEIHTAKAFVVAECPDFDGLSGAPLFHILNKNAEHTRTRFVGMLLRGTRSSEIVHFLSAERIKFFLVDVMMDGVTDNRKRAERLAQLFKIFMG